MLINVVLPAPFGPISACTDPGAICTETFRKACKPPKDREMFFTSSAAPPAYAFHCGAPSALAPAGRLGSVFLTRPASVPMTPFGKKYSVIRIRTPYTISR